MSVTKIVAMGDQHAGHRVGLTPLSYDRKPKLENVSQRYKNNVARWYQPRRELWNEYVGFTESIGQPDILIVNGDCVDGKGKKSGGTELIEPDIGIQIDIAVAGIQKWNAKQIFMTYGTGYHTGNDHDYEDEIAERVGATIKSHLYLDIDGVVFDVKHHPASGSNIPHTRKGPMLDWLWNLVKSGRDEVPKADVIIRNHLHWYQHTGNTDYLAIQMPALQGAGSKFGGRRCNGTVDFGVVSFEVEDGEVDFTPHIVQVKSQKQEAIIVKA
jgi:hypothetical protein